MFPGVTRTNGIAFGENLDEPGQVLRLDLYEPAGDTADDRPVVIWAHGGGFTSGNRGSGNIRQLAEAMARRGYVSASIDYRLSDVEGVAAIRRAVVDLRTAVRWFRANAGDLRIDPDRISVGGYSAGAVMALTAALDGGDTPGSHQGWPSDVAAAVSFSGAGLTDGVQGDPPVLMFHGDLDDRVPYAGDPWGAMKTCRVARFFRSDCIFHTFPGVTHGIFDDGERDALMHAETARFLSCRVGAAGAFTDLAPWVEPAAGWAGRAGVVNGFADGSFQASRPVTRGQLVAMLWRLVGSPEGGESHEFSDVPAWLGPAMDWARSAGVVEGFADGTVRPGRSVTRGQAARMLQRTAGGTTTGLLGHGLLDVPRWLEDPVQWLVARRPVQLLAGHGIATGYADRTFRPDQPVTRGQVVTWLHGLALAGTAWDAARQADPGPTACHRIFDPPA